MVIYYKVRGKIVSSAKYLFISSVDRSGGIVFEFLISQNVVEFEFYVNEENSVNFGLR